MNRISPLAMILLLIPLAAEADNGLSEATRGRNPAQPPASDGAAAARQTAPTPPLAAPVDSSMNAGPAGSVAVTGSADQSNGSNLRYGAGYEARRRGGGPCFGRGMGRGR
jgi:hypothetical protein